MEQIDSDTYRWASGRTLRVHKGIIGTNAFGGVYGGYDEVIVDDDGDLLAGQPWTVEERRELAEFMIRRWARWRDLPAPP